jgi:diguanylate cyclase (GGDEF)-like protein
MMINDKAYLLIYNNTGISNIDTEYLNQNGVLIKYASSETEALNLARKHQIGIFLVFFDSNDNSPIYVLRKMMQQFPYIQRFIISPQINNDVMELAVNKAHINYFLLYPLENEVLLKFIQKALRRYHDVIRPFQKLDKLTDVTIELIEDISRYREEANKDSLTGLLNRRSFDNILQRYYYMFMKKDIPFVLAMLDIDDFKNVNDTYGHAAGDVVLKEFSTVIAGISRLGEDFAFRYGGEEFAILSHGNSEMEIESYLKRLLTIIRNLQVKLKKHSISFTFSAGIAVINNETSADQLVRNADSALYFAKSNGKNQIAIYNRVKSLIKQ